MAFNYSPKIVTDGLVLYLDAANPKSYVSGSTTWNDISRSQLATTTLSAGTTYTSSFNGALVVDGTTTIAVPFVLDTSTNYTIEVAAKSYTMTTNSTNRQTVWSFVSGSSQGYQLLDLEIWGDGITLFNGDNNLYASPLRGGLVPLGTTDIKVYTVSKSGSIQSWYINGILRTSVTQTYTGSSQYFKLGSRNAGAAGVGQAWSGSFPSAKIYNRSLTAQEVLQNYNATKTRFGLT